MESVIYHSHDTKLHEPKYFVDPPRFSVMQTSLNKNRVIERRAEDLAYDELMKIQVESLRKSSRSTTGPGEPDLSLLPENGMFMKCTELHEHDYVGTGSTDMPTIEAFKRQYQPKEYMPAGRPPLLSNYDYVRRLQRMNAGARHS